MYINIYKILLLNTILFSSILYKGKIINKFYTIFNYSSLELFFISLLMLEI